MRNGKEKNIRQYVATHVKSGRHHLPVHKGNMSKFKKLELTLKELGLKPSRNGNHTLAFEIDDHVITFIFNESNNAIIEKRVESKCH